MNGPVNPNCVYLDYNASTPIKPEARAALIDALSHTGNASSVHGPGRAGRARIDRARGRIAALAGTKEDRVVLTSGATEANSLVLSGSGRRRLLVSAIEHDSVRHFDPAAESVAVTPDGIIDLADLERRLAASTEPALVALMLVNNETGVIQPMAEAVAVARRYGAVVHCDAVQAGGRIPIDMAALGADFLTLSAHKLGGPQGAGALILGMGRDVAPLIRGGGQERGRRGGTENVAAISGFGVAAELAVSDIAIQKRLADWRAELERRILAAAPGARIFGANAPRIANTLCVAMPGVPSETQVIAFDLAGIAVSAGAACSSGRVQASHVLRAMGADESLVGSAIRISAGYASTAADFDRALEIWIDLYNRAGRGTSGVAAPAATVARAGWVV